MTVGGCAGPEDHVGLAGGENACPDGADMIHIASGGKEAGGVTRQGEKPTTKKKKKKKKKKQKTKAKQKEL